MGHKEFVTPQWWVIHVLANLPKGTMATTDMSEVFTIQSFIWNIIGEPPDSSWKEPILDMHIGGSAQDMEKNDSYLSFLMSM